MRNKAYRLLLAMLGASFVLTACGSNRQGGNIVVEEADKSNISSDVSGKSETSNSGVVTISDLKQKYGTADKKEYKPFYNVEQQTQFTFHFNSDVEPCRAITVHTDSKCEKSSTVYQINDGYKTDSGVDVVVKAGSPVLNNESHAGGYLANYNWGYAPIYYICIRYDMDASEPVLLDEPIVIPFTVRSDVSVPNTYYSINSDGDFTINWKPVDDAVKYNIYYAFRVRPDSAARNLTRAEAGYVGDHLEKIGTVDGTVTSFSNFGVSSHADNLLTDMNGYIMSQNTFDLGSYYVTAVDSAGNESMFSLAVEGWKYGSQLPKTFDDYISFSTRNEMGYVTYLPMSVPVNMCDGSVNNFPINYKKVSEEYECAIYEYAIAGTKLTGTVSYFNESGEYEDEIISTYNMNSDLYKVSDNIQVIPSKEVQTVSGDYAMDLSKPVDRDQLTKIVYSKDALLLRADLENARIATDGVYPDTTEIETYIADDYNSSSVVSEVTEVESAVVEETKSEVNDESLSRVDVDVITSDNLVDKQDELTSLEVAEAELVEIPITGYPVWADSAEEEYLAMAMINRQESIDISAFPALQNMEYLQDVFYKLTFQNPYIISPLGLSYDFETHMVYPAYAYDIDTTRKKQDEIAETVVNITNSIISSDMTDEAKVNAVWNYLESNTAYDYNALSAAEASDFSLPVGYEDSFNAYGILVNKLGVCQSYAYANKLLLDACGVDSVTLTGYLNSTVPHAWNAVNLNDNWYWIDTTNNEMATGIPYFMYQTSSDFAEQVSYVLDTDFELDVNVSDYLNSDTSKDWYVENNLYAAGDDELINLLVDQYKNTEKNTIAIKCAYEPVTDEAFINKFGLALIDAGATKDEIMNMKFGYSVGYFILIR